MHVVASFKLNKNLEKAIAELEFYGIDRTHILALPLATAAEREMNVPDRKILFESSPIFGTILMLLGTIYGYVLPLGPIIWALIGLVVGMGAGIALDLFRVVRKRKNRRYEDGRTAEVFLWVYCRDREQALSVRDKLWSFLPNGVTMYSSRSEEREA
ncbi:hypothetical protein MO973_44280 [Paenibacillus sp. TRM 82003]|nr:hypothetical protein [Paenibacillus sp. TRM 82003]